MLFCGDPLVAPKDPSPGTRKDPTTYETEIRQKFDKRLAESFMDFDKAAEKGSKKFADDFRGALLKYLPIAALLLTVLTFLLNFGVLSIASRAMPFDVVQTRAHALTDAIQKQTDELRTENQNLKQRLDDMKVELDRLSKRK